MLDLVLSTQFKRDRRLAMKRGYDLALLSAVVNILRIPQPLPPKYRDHDLTGNYIGFRECHISPDWLLVYKGDGDILYLDRTGSHSDLFR